MRQAAERIVKLALLDTSARPDTPEQTAGREKQIAVVQAGGYGDITDFADSALSASRRSERRTLTTIVRQMVAETGPEAFVRELRAIIGRPDSRPLLASIRCPTLVLVGDGDMATPPDLAKEIAAGIAGSPLVIVPDCGHLVDHRTAGGGECGARRVARRREPADQLRVITRAMTTTENRDTAGVIAPPPLIALAAVVLGLLLDRLLPAYVLTVLLPLAGAYRHRAS